MLWSPLVLLVLCFVVPDHFPPWTAYHTEVSAFAAAALAMVLVWVYGLRQSLRPGVLVALVAGVALAWLQWGARGQLYFGDAVLVSAYLLLLACGYVWGGAWVQKDGAAAMLTAVSAMWLVVGLALTFQMLAQWNQVEAHFGGWIIDRWGNRAAGNVGQPNQAGTALVLGAAATVLLYQRRVIGGWVLGLCLPLLVWGMVMCQSRTALLSSTLVALFLLAAGPRLGLGTRRAPLVWLCLIWGLTYAGHELDWLTHPLLKGMLGIAPMGQMTDPNGRFLMWQQMLMGIAQEPWLGHGWLQTPAAQQAAALTLPSVFQTNYAHNATLDLALWLGIPATLLLLLAFAGLAWRYAKPVLASPERVGLLLLLVPIAVHSQLEFPHAYSYYLLPVGLTLGALLHGWDGQQAGDGMSSTRPVRGLKRAPVAALAVVSIGLWGAMAYEYAAIEEDFRVNRFENRRLGATPEGYAPPQPVLLTQFGELLQAMRLRAKPGMSADDLALLERVSRRFSWAPIHFRTGLSLALNGRQEDALHYFRVLKNMYPEAMYQEAVDAVGNMAREEYPQLRSLKLP